MAQKNLLNMVHGTLEQGCIMAMSTATPLVGALEVVEIKGNSYAYNVVDTLLPTAHRELGEEVVANEMQTEKVVRELKILSNAIRTDRVYGVISDITDVKAQSTELAMVSNGKAFEKETIKELKSLEAQGVAGKKFTGALTVDLLDDALDYVNGANLIFTNAKGQRALKKLLKTEGQALETIDSFGKRVVAYNGIPVHVSDDLTDTEILVVRAELNGVHLITNGGLVAYEQQENIFDVTYCELLHQVCAKTKNAFARVDFTASKSK